MPSWLSGDMILGFVRHGVTTLGGMWAAKGYLGESEVEAFVGAIMVIVGLAFSYLDKKKKAEK